MEERNKWTFNGNSDVISRHSSIDKAGDSFLPNVFAFMSFGLLLTGALAYLFGTNEEFTRLLFNSERTGFSIFGYYQQLGSLDKRKDW